MMMTCIHSQQLFRLKKGPLLFTVLLLSLQATGQVICKEEALIREDLEQQGLEDFSLFQRGQTLSKTQGALSGLFASVDPLSAEKDPWAWCRDLGIDVSMAIDLLFLAVMISMVMKWYQDKREVKNVPGGGAACAGSTQHQAHRLRQPQEQQHQQTQQPFSSDCRKGSVVSRKGGAARENRVDSGKADEMKKLRAANVTKLHAAVAKEDFALCEQLFAEYKFSVDEADTWLCTSLHVAAHKGSSAMAEWLLGRGAKVNATDAWDQTPLHFAAQSGYHRVCKLLISYGADLAAEDAMDRTAVFLAGTKGHAEAADVLLRSGGTLGNKSEPMVPPLLNNLILQHMFEDMSGKRDGNQAISASNPAPKSGSGLGGLGLL